MRNALATSAALVLVAATVACEVAPPPPPLLTVTSPRRGMIQSDAGRVMVTGTALPGPSGEAVTSVKVNNVPAALAADGSFSAIVDVPAGVLLLETVATSQAGSKATDARAVQVGQLRPVGTPVERAVTASLSADAFAKLSAAAGPILKATDFTTLLAPLQPMANLGNDAANLKLSITKLTLGDAKITMTPVDGGLAFSAELGGLNVAATAAYGGILVPDGSTSVRITADAITITGTLVVTPAGTRGFTTTIATPAFRTTNLQLAASGLVGDLLDLLQANLGSTIQRVAATSAERALSPMINKALGALVKEQQLDVLGRSVGLQVSPSAIAFTRAGALVTLDLTTKIAGSESSPGYIFTPNGTPTMSVGNGIQLGISDDLVNQLLAQVHTLGLLDLRLQKDFGLFDTAELKLTMPPMISANTSDRSLRLVLGDMIATFTDQGKPLISAALNAQVDLEITRGTKPEEIAFELGKVHLFVNVLDPAADPDGMAADDIASAATAGIGVQLDSLEKFLITVPVPTVAGVTLDNLSLRADSGYALVSGQIH